MTSGALGAGLGQPAGDAALTRFCQTLERFSGLSYQADKAYLFTSRLKDLPVAQKGYQGLEEAMWADPQLRQSVIEALVTSETYFFRDESTFEQLPELVPPGLYTAESPLVVWSLGCSTGQEALSVLIRLEESGAVPLHAVKVVGVDISAGVLAKAAEATYSGFEVGRGLSPLQLARCFEAVPEGFRARAAYRQRCEWVRLNLLDGVEKLPRPHLVFCRNVLIYFSDDNKRKVVAHVAKHLLPEGKVILGHSENPLAFKEWPCVAARGPLR